MQLKSISNLAALVAGFAMISFLQFTFQNTDASDFVIVGFGVTTALVVSTALFSHLDVSANSMHIVIILRLYSCRG